MNSKKSVAYGWAAFTVAGVIGSYIGWQKGNEGTEDRQLEAKKQLEEQNKRIKKMNDELKIKKTLDEDLKTSSQSNNKKNIMNANENTS